MIPGNYPQVALFRASEKIQFGHEYLESTLL